MKKRKVTRKELKKQRQFRNFMLQNKHYKEHGYIDWWAIDNYVQQTYEDRLGPRKKGGKHRYPNMRKLR